MSIGFDGGQLSSAAGVLVLRGVEQKLGLARRLAPCLRDRRKAERIEHRLDEMLRFRMFAIAAGYEDADDCAALRHDAVFKMAAGRRALPPDPERRGAVAASNPRVETSSHENQIHRPASHQGRRDRTVVPRAKNRGGAGKSRYLDE